MLVSWNPSMNISFNTKVLSDKIMTFSTLCYLLSAVSFSPERKIFNEKMIQRYLTPDQTKRLNIFSQTIASGLNPNDTKILLVSWNGILFVFSSSALVRESVKIYHKMTDFNQLESTWPQNSRFWLLFKTILGSAVKIPQECKFLPSLNENISRN